MLKLHSETFFSSLYRFIFYVVIVRKFHEWYLNPWKNGKNRQNNLGKVTKNGENALEKRQKMLNLAENSILIWLYSVILQNT